MPIIIISLVLISWAIIKIAENSGKRQIPYSKKELEKILVDNVGKKK